MIYNVENLREDVTIHLGNQGENDAVVLQFDISQWAEKWPGGQASITYRRPNDPAVYPVLPGKVIVDDNVLSWTIDNDVTAVDGRGQAIIMYKQDDIVSHTVRMSTLVRPGLPTAGSPPNPVANWLQEAQGIMGQIANLRFEINADGELEASTSEGSLGRVRIVPRGQYYPNVEYKFLDMVFDGGNSYLYKDVPKSTGTPVTDTSHWQQIASIGGQDLVDAAVAARNAAQAQAALAQGYAAQLAAGTASPAGTYANLAALIAADPGHDKIYITLDDGNWCYHNGSAWVAGGVYQAASVAEDIEAIRAETLIMRELESTGFKYGKINVGDNSTVDLEAVDTSTAGWVHKIVACRAGDTIKITGHGGNIPRLWAKIASDGTVLSRAGINASATDLVLPITQDCFFLFNATSSYNYEVTGTIRKNVNDVLREGFNDFGSRLVSDETFKLDAFNAGTITTNLPIGETVSYSVNASPTFGHVVLNCRTGMTFKFKGLGGNASRLWCFVDNDDKVVSQSGINETDAEVTAPVDGKIIINVKTYGESPSVEYTPYDINSIVGVVSDIQSKLKKKVLTDDISSEAVTIHKTDFVKTGSNLFNFRSLTQGYLIASDGVVTASDGYGYSELIPVEQGKTYFSKNITSIAFYSRDKVFVNRIFSTIEGYTFTVAPGIYYIVLNVQKPLTWDSYLNKGADAGYEPYLLTVDNLRIQSTNAFDKYNFPPDLPNGFALLPTATYTAFETPAELKSAYDALAAAYPGYVTVNVLGKDESETYDIYEVKLTPAQPANTGASIIMRNPLPKIVYTTGVHGGEKGGVNASYYLVKALCEEWDSNECLEFIRHNIEIRFIALANPWAFVNPGVFGGRLNANGVDINRNQAFYWVSGTPGTSTYGGVSAVSEAESIIIKDFIDENADAMFFIDYHTNGTSGTNWVDTMFLGVGGSFVQDDLMIGVGQYWLKRMSRELVKNYSIEPDVEILGTLYKENVGGKVGAYAASLGMHATTLETWTKFPTDETYYNSNTVKGSAEALCNFFIMTCRRLAMGQYNYSACKS